MPQNPSRSAASGRSGARKAGSISPKHRGHRPTEAPAKNRWSSARRAEAQGRPAEGGDSRPDWTPPEHRPARRVAGQRFGRPDERRRPDSWQDRGGAPAGRDGARQDRGDRPRRFEDERPARRYEDRDDRRPADRDERRFSDRDDRRGSGRDDRRSFEPRDDRRSSERDERRSADRNDRPYAERDDRRFAERNDRRSDRFERPERDSRGSDGNDRRSDRDDRFERPERRAEGRRFGGPREEFARPHREPRETGERERRYVQFQERTRGQRPEHGHRFEASGRPERRMNDVEDVVHERLEAVSHTAEETQGVTFGDLGLGANIVRTLGELGATSPFPIQAATIPDVLAGRNVLGRGRTGSGKTIAFGAPVVERILQGTAGTKRVAGRTPRALILAPTRELALQIDDTIQPIARSVGLFTTQVYGGVPQARQVGALRRGVDIVIGTPGRIEDLLEQGHLDLGSVEIVVLDEADHMTDLGFLEPVQRILRSTKPGGQRLLFSATLDKAVTALVEEFLVDPAIHEVAGEDQASSTIEHRVLLIDQKDKIRLVTELASHPGKTLVFARTRAFAEQLAEELIDLGVPATSLHGDLNQAKRTRNLERLATGRVRVLVATDVAARGIHVDDVELVVQADAPEEYKTYLHRSGRTGRAGREGTVVTLIARSRRRRLEELLDRAEIDAELTVVPSGGDLPEELVSA